MSPIGKLDKPVPREPKSPRHQSQVQTQNRRREYLTRNDSYFASLEHEFADPVLYERLVKKFQTAPEREAEGKAKGYGRTLEADLIRGESKLANIAQSNGNGQARDGSDTGLEAIWERPARGKEDGLTLWRAFLEERFIKGQDEDFDYGTVDNNEDLDAMVRKDAEDAWFDDEEPHWEADDEEMGSTRNEASNRQGETGIQDF